MEAVMLLASGRLDVPLKIFTDLALLTNKTTAVDSEV
jgi:hypothetical protein